ncbi:MAG: nickel pincer cofactor biosynthesis protein LarB [Planctomycetota bacterium]
MDLKQLLDAVAAHALPVPDALERLAARRDQELGYACLDGDRARRCGVPEVVFAERKTPEQTAGILAALLQKEGRAFATRVPDAALALVRERFPDAVVNDMARTVRLGALPETPSGARPVLVIAAGTSDLSVAEEAAESARYAGAPVDRLFDVGVAGLHRLLRHRDRLAEAGALIVAAGMEGALPSVVGGLVRAPVIAVPTSVGYGASFGGLAALLGMLNSCAAGVSVVNIDNGFGAGITAARIVLAPVETSA